MSETERKIMVVRYDGVDTIVSAPEVEALFKLRETCSDYINCVSSRWDTTKPYKELMEASKAVTEARYRYTLKPLADAEDAARRVLEDKAFLAGKKARLAVIKELITDSPELYAFKTDEVCSLTEEIAVLEYKLPKEAF